MTKVKCVQIFYDLKEKVNRKPEETFECSKERAELLRGLKLVEIQNEKPEPEVATPEVKKETAAKTKKAKK